MADDARRCTLRLRVQHRAAIAAQLDRAAGNGHQVLDSLCDRPIESMNDVKFWTGTIYAAANGLAASLVRLGVLAKITGYARNRRFCCAL